MTVSVLDFEPPQTENKNSPHHYTDLVLMKEPTWASKLSRVNCDEKVFITTERV